MSRPEPALDSVRLRQVIVTLLDHALPACTHVEYRLVGTGAALLHGVALPAADVDILVRQREDVNAFGATLSSFRCLEPPEWLPETRQYYGNYEVDGVEVGFSTVELEAEADTIETFGRGPWEHYILIPCGPYHVPTVKLELRLVTELFRDRPDRYRPIMRYLQVKGCDIDLISRGIVAAGLPGAVQKQVLSRLKGLPVN
jgi:hypothetical protein